MFAPESLVRHILGRQYRVDALIGKGGFGAVYRAWDLHLQVPVAVKIILNTAVENAVARFTREAQLQARLRHPAIVKLLHFGEQDGLRFMVQEFVDGQTLSAVVRRVGPLPAERAWHLLDQLLDALDEAHAQGVVHRDLKPQNIMVVQGRRGEEIRLLDFGIAKILEEAEEAESLTATGTALGSPSWMAPEQASGHPITAASDLYSLGCVLFYALTGHPPFRGNTAQLVLAHVQAPPPPLPDHVPDPLRAVIERAMEKIPEHRFASAAAMRTALRSGLTTPHSQRLAPAAPVTQPALFELADPTRPMDATPMSISNIEVTQAPLPARSRLWPIALVGLGAAAAAVGWLLADPGPSTSAAVTQTAQAPIEPTATAQAAKLAGADAPAPGPATPDPPVQIQAVDFGLGPLPDAAEANPAVEVAAVPDAAVEDAAPARRAKAAQARTGARARRASTQRATPKKAAPKAKKPSHAKLLQSFAVRVEACECGAAQPLLARLNAAGVDRAAAYRARCGRARGDQPAGTCAQVLEGRLTRAMKTCPCHGQAVQGLVRRLKTEFNVDRSVEWTRRCVTPGLPGSCTGLTP